MTNRLIHFLIIFIGATALQLNLPISAMADPIVITELQSVDFGMIPNTNGTCKLKFNGNLTGTCIGQGQIGIHQINGTPRTQVSVSVSEQVEVQPGLTYKPKLKKEVLNLNRRGRAKAKVAGELQLNNTQSGLLNFNYILTINYI